MAKKQTTFSPEVLISLQRGSGQPLSRQLSQTLRTSIRSGIFQAGDCLPASRVLARDLGVSRSVVVETYAQLVAEGYLVSTPRSGTRIAATGSGQVAPLHTPEAASALRYDFRPGVPDTTMFPRSAWAKAIQHVLLTAPHPVFGYGDARGAEVARVELAAYLQRVRGVVAHPDHLILTTGFAQGLGLLCQVLQAQGIRRLAVEDPAHPGQRALLGHFGMELVALPVDEEGLRVDELTRSPAQAVLVTPAHQFPTGVVLSPARRRALAHWAQRQAGIIIEDDYDAEFRYDRAPVGALQGVAPEQVIYAGSASKMLAPALRIGWLVIPPRWSKDLLEAKCYADLGSSVLDQLTFAHLLASGQVDRHLRRMRQLYRTRRDSLVASVNAYLPEATIGGIAAGLHAVVSFPGPLGEAELEQSARVQGIGLYGLQRFFLRENAAPPAFVMGYAALSETAIKTSMQLLGHLVKETVSSSSQ